LFRISLWCRAPRVGNCSNKRSNQKPTL
jgi:hypothetical protein